MQKKYRFLQILHAFVGIGALGGGLGALLNPDGPMGISTDVLKNAPFDNFFIPGLFLFFVLGVGNLICAFLMRFHLKFQAYINGTFALTLVLWIVIQVYMLQGYNILHIIYFLIGAVEGCLSLFMLYENKLFPVNLLLRKA